MRDFRDAKIMAKTLRAMLAEKQLAVSHSESLELIAKTFGLANWNVLAAAIDRESRAHVLAADDDDTSFSGPRTPAMSPSFIVSDVPRTIAFYCEKLGFSVGFSAPDDDPFFAVLYRDGAQLFVKSQGGIAPVPNNTRHRHLRWDAYVYAPDPDAVYADFSARGTPFSQPLRDTHDGLRGFEVTDPDGFVLFFGRPL